MVALGETLLMPKGESAWACIAPPTFAKCAPVRHLLPLHPPYAPPVGGRQARNLVKRRGLMERKAGRDHSYMQAMLAATVR